MNLDKIRPALGRLFGGKNDDDEGRLSRRRLLLGLGCTGIAAFAVPTLLLSGEADADSLSIHIGPRRRRRYWRRRRYYRRPPWAYRRRRRYRRWRRRRHRRHRRRW